MPQLQKKSVLICDDEAEIRELIRDTIVQAYPSLNIVEAGDGSEAYAKASRQYFDLVITDVHMPKRDGVKLVQSFEQLKDGFRPKRVIVISGKVTEEDMRNNDIGSVVFLPKPCDFNLLKQEVAKALSMSSQEAGTDFRPETILLPTLLGSAAEALSQYSETTFKKDQVVASKDQNFGVQYGIIQRFGTADFAAFYVLSVEEALFKHWSEKKKDAFEILREVNLKVFNDFQKAIAQSGISLKKLGPVFLRGSDVDMMVANGIPRIVAKLVCERGAATLHFALEKHTTESSEDSLI